MSDFARFLPLSNRAHGDESAVSSDRRVAEADVIEEAAAHVAAVADPRAAADRFVREAHLQAFDADGSGDPGERLRAIAERLRTGRKRSIRSLAATVRALLVLGETSGRTVSLAPATSGAVALYGVTATDFARRAVFHGHAVRAVDAEWEFGRGPVLSGTAIGIVSFLLGLSEDPPVSSTR